MRFGSGFVEKGMQNAPCFSLSLSLSRGGGGRRKLCAEQNLCRSNCSLRVSEISLDVIMNKVFLSF